jgi:hypothetical protein
MHVDTTAMAAALGWSTATVRRTAERGDLGPVSRTPGGGKRLGEWRWEPEVAAAIVRAHGKTPPSEWTPTPTPT